MTMTTMNRAKTRLALRIMTSVLGMCGIISTSMALAASPITNYEYDANGNRTKVTDALNHVTLNTFDTLNRVIQIKDANNGETLYAYNALNQLVQVTDPRGLITTYTYDGLGNLKQQVSPDTGTTTFTYDAAGNLLTKADAKGQITTYTYDSLNRITSITYHDSSQVTYQYDQGANGIGRLSSITDSLGSITYAYDNRGRVTSETRIIGADTYVTGYSYDAAGHLIGMAYPGGRTLSYTLDSLGRAQQILTSKDGVSQVLVNNIQYRPFGPTQGFIFANGTPYNRQFDQDGRIVAYSLGNQTMALGYDEASRISFMSDTGNPVDTKSYNYDALDRLIQYTAPNENQGYSYDADGNRTALTLGANTYTYSYPGTSNRLTSTQGPTPDKSYIYDANGSPTTDGTNQFAYDARGRLTQAVTANGTYTYAINALGQRIKKSTSTAGTIFHYDLQGRLIAETDTQTAQVKEYIYLNDIPVAVMQ